VVGCKQHHTAELATAEKAVTVLKNANNTLPLKTTDKAAFFYPYTGEADSLTFGVHTVNPSLNVPTYCYRNSSADDYNNVIKSVSTLIIYTEAYSASYFNPSSASGWQAVFVQDMINKAHSLGKKVVIVSIHLPYDVAKYTNADAILLAYGAKDMKTVPTKWNGEVKTFGINIPASAAVIFGGAKPQGKLPVDIYRLDSNNQYTSQILFPLGTGLSLNFN
ncbi:MAG: glycoside hydrolase family 3 C-terminal domain-containing protein, partial [Ruminococcus sp.]|nr:glycoside hydrolase family 3 C-terminal domain-containing protein [Candidatus Copronaster equi]